MKPVRQGRYVNIESGVAMWRGESGWYISRPTREGRETVHCEWYFNTARRFAKERAAEILTARDADHAEALELNS